MLNGEPSSGAAPLGWNYPLALADAVQKHAAEVAYGSSNGKAVVLTVTLRPDAARRRMQEALRAEWSATGSLAATLIAASSGGKRAGPAAGEEAEGRFREALATLEASTVCRWTADRRTWFPLQLKEETVLRYTIAGKAYVEKRSSVTSFRARLDSDTIGRSEGMKPLSDR